MTNDKVRRRAKGKTSSCDACFWESPYALVTYLKIKHNSTSFLQKFRFCGDGDCPDWVLAEIISTLSNLSVDNLEQLAQIVAKCISGEQFEVSYW